MYVLKGKENQNTLALLVPGEKQQSDIQKFPLPKIFLPLGNLNSKGQDSAIGGFTETQTAPSTGFLHLAQSEALILFLGESFVRHCDKPFPPKESFTIR